LFYSDTMIRVLCALHLAAFGWILGTVTGLSLPWSPKLISQSSSSEHSVGRRTVMLGPGLLAASRAVAFVAGAPHEVSAKGDGSIIATDRSGAEVVASKWLAAHPAPYKADLVLGPGGEPHFLLIQPGSSSSSSGDGSSGDSRGPQLAAYALKAECTHLGCLVALDYESAAAGVSGFACPCHGSRYSGDGKVLRGPAPRALSLASVTVREDGKVVMAPWVGPDFRST